MKSHDDLKQWYLDTLTHTQDNRALCERDRDYYDNKQWTSDEENELKKRKQPVITVNRIKPKIDSIIGLEIRSRVDIKAFPRTPNDEAGAEAATDSLRYIADNKDFDQIKTEVAEDLFIEGTAAAIVEVEKTKKGYEVCPRVIPWDRFFIDPHSVRKDGKDALFMGQAIWLEEDVAKAMFPGKEDLLNSKLEENAGDTYDDKPKNSFYDQTRKRVKIIEVYFNSEGWKHAIYTGGGYLAEPKDSPYLDEDGDPTNPIEVQSAFIDRNNNRYGSVRQMISIQDEINKRRSKSLHLLNNRQTIGEKGAVTNVNAMKREMAKPDGHVEVTPGLRFDRLDNSDLAMGQLNLLQEAKGEIDQIGANASVTGKEERNLSGRALQVRQQAGTVELSPVLDGLRSWEKRMYRQMWMRVKQFWTEEKWIRVTDDEKNLKFVGLNKPITLGEQLQNLAQDESANPMERQNAIGLLQELMRTQDPRLNQVASVENPVTELDVDIILEAVPDTVNIEAEQFELLANMYSANPNAIPFEMIIESSSLRNKERILERLNGATPEEQQARQMQQEIAQRSAIAEIQKTESEAAENMANAQRSQADAAKTTIEAMNESRDLSDMSTEELIRIAAGGQ